MVHSEALWARGGSSLSSYHHVRGHYRNGRWVRAHRARNPGRRSDSGGPSGPRRPVKPLKPPVHQKLPKLARITITIVISVIVIAAGTTVGLETVGSGSGPSSSGSKAVADIEPLSVQASLKGTEATLTASGFGGYLVPGFDENCSSHSYGKIQSFFRSHPCRWLARAYIVLNVPKQDAMLIAISWVDMPTSSLAEQYKHLMDKPGTGSVTELSRETGSYQNIAFTENYHLSGIIGTIVWNVQVQPIGSVAISVINKVLGDSRQ